MRKMILAAVLIALTVTAGAQSRDRSQTPDKFKWNLAEIYPSDARVACREGQAVGRPAAAAPVPGQAVRVRRVARRRARSAGRLLEGAGAVIQLREPGGGSGHARLDPRRHASGDEPAGGRVRRRVVVHRTGAGEGRRGQDPRLRRRRTAAEGVRLLPRRRLPPRAAHADRRRGEAAGRRRPARRQSGQPVQHPLERRFSVPDGDAERRQERQAGSGGLRRASRAAQPRRS